MRGPIGFPGAVFDPEGVTTISGLPDLDQATIDLMPCRCVVGADAPSNGVLPVGRVWLLEAGATLSRIPPAERHAARAMMREGLGIMLLAPDADTENAIRTALLELCDADETPAGRFGHA